MQALIASLRLTLVTLLICVVGYVAVLLGVAQVVAPETAEAALVRRGDGTIVGSRQVAQQFTEARYLWPRPSAVDYNGAGAGGSNLSPTNPELTARAQEFIARYGATPERPLPAELVAASGSGLDPHVTLRAAHYQAARIAEARSLPVSRVRALLDDHAFAPGGPFTPEKLVNVLQVNVALDEVAAPVAALR